jgi:hypothetical protein
MQLKSNAVALRHADAKGERNYGSYSFLTSALNGVNGQRHAQAALYRGKGPPPPPILIVKEARCASDLIWTQRLEKNSKPLTGIEYRSSIL